MKLDDKALQKIAKTIYHKFPELDGAAPSVQVQSSPQAKNLSARPHGDRYVITFSKPAKLPDGQQINRVVRVVAGPRGKVLKISTSR